MLCGMYPGQFGILLGEYYAEGKHTLSSSTNALAVHSSWAEKHDCRKNTGEMASMKLSIKL